MFSDSAEVDQRIDSFDERFRRRCDQLERRIVIRLGLLMAIGFGCLLILIATRN